MRRRSTTVVTKKWTAGVAADYRTVLMNAIQVATFPEVVLTEFEACDEPMSYYSLQCPLLILTSAAEEG
jgi:hypothetical protein